MNTKKIWTGMTLVSVLLLLAGCAISPADFVSVRIPAIAPPGKMTTGKSISGKTVMIRLISDERRFEQNPRDASIPSLSSTDPQSHTIARKYTDLGKAPGGAILLPDNQTVEGLIRAYLIAALEQVGYRVINDTSAGKASLVIDVHIKQFWAWVKAGFSTVTFYANIETDLNITRVKTPISIKIHAEQSHMLPSISDWQEILQKALGDYRAQIVSSSQPGKPLSAMKR